MTHPIDRVLDALRTLGAEPKRTGKGWSCACPAHDDRNPSLSIRVGNDGRVLYKCHAGCSFDAVCRAIGLKATDLFEKDPSKAALAPRRDTKRVSKTPSKRDKHKGSGDGDGMDFASANDAIKELERRYGPRVGAWTYRNSNREPVGVVVRWDTPTGKKILPVSKHGARWANRGMPEPRVLYRLPDLIDSKPGDRIYVTEGEKAAEAARAIGLTATTSPHGSKSASKADWTPLAGREVIILPDHDDAGDRYAQDVTRFVVAAGAKSVRVVRLVELWPEMPAGGDIADLVNHRAETANSLRSELEQLVERTQIDRFEDERVPTLRFQPFPCDVIPDPVRAYIQEKSRSIGCDASFIALSFLTACASAIGNTYRIRLKREWHEPAILWTVIVGESGTHKTPAFKVALKPLRQHQAEAHEQHAANMSEYEDRVAHFEVDHAAWKRDSTKRKAGKSEFNDPPPRKPSPPREIRFIVSDTTVEALAPILLANPRGVLLGRDELAGWLNSFDRYSKGGRGGADAAHWLSMFNGEALTIDRKTGVPPTIYVPSASVSITGGIQPSILARAMGSEHRENGMLARMLFAMPPRRKKRWTDGDLSSPSDAAVKRMFQRLLSLEMQTDSLDVPAPLSSYKPHVIDLSMQGKEAWVRFYNEHAHKQESLSGEEAAAAAKLEAYVARFALIFHIIRWAASDAPASSIGTVDEACVMAGVALVEWFGNEARRVHAILSESDEDRETRRLVEWIERKGGSVTVRDLTHGMRAYRGDSESAESALAALVKIGLGCWQTDPAGPQGGRSSRRFQLVTDVTVTETPHNSEQKASNGDGNTANPNQDEWGEL